MLVLTGKNIRGAGTVTVQSLEKPLVFGKQENEYIIVQNYFFDKTMAKEGNTSLCVRFHSDFNWWNELYSDRDKYMEVKDNLAAQII